MQKAEQYTSTYLHPAEGLQRRRLDEELEHRLVDGHVGAWGLLALHPGVPFSQIEINRG